MCIAFFTLCSWLSIPFFINITLQVFAVFFVSSIATPAISFLSVISYISLGLVGVPVLSGFKGGISAFAGASGGFIIGLAFSALIISLFSHCYSEKKYLHLTVMFLSLFVCYLCGVLWYMFVFNYSVNVSFIDCLLICVIPFVVPDILKIFLVWIAYRKLFPYLKRLN
jgi:biotin transport system substrate-specific component